MAGRHLSAAGNRVRPMGCLHGAARHRPLTPNPLRQVLPRDRHQARRLVASAELAARRAGLDTCRLPAPALQGAGPPGPQVSSYRSEPHIAPLSCSAHISSHRIAGTSSDARSRLAQALRQARAMPTRIHTYRHVHSKGDERHVSTDERSLLYSVARYDVHQASHPGQA